MPQNQLRTLKSAMNPTGIESELETVKERKS